MPSLDKALADEPIRGLVYGRTGTAKTVLWGLMSKHEQLRPIYCLDFDLRIASLRAVLTPQELGFIYYDEFRDNKVQGEAFVAAQSIANNPGRLNEKFGVTFKTIVVDSGSFMLKSIMNRIFALDSMKPSTTTPQLQHYMQQQSCVTDFVEKLCASGLNFIFTAHEDLQKDEGATGKVFLNVDLTGKMANRIPGYFNEFWHTEVQQKAGQEPAFVIRTRSDATYSARTSYKQLAAVEAQAKVWPKILGLEK